MDSVALTLVRAIASGLCLAAALLGLSVVALHTLVEQPPLAVSALAYTTGGVLFVSGHVIVRPERD